MKNNTFFLDTMQGLLEAIAINRGAIEMQPIEGMPGETLRPTAQETKRSKDEVIIA